MDRNPKAIWHVVRVQHDMSPFLSMVYTWWLPTLPHALHALRQLCGSTLIILLVG